MPKDDGDKIQVSSEAWNMADSYVKFKILKQVVVADKLETIAIYGTEDIDDQQITAIPFEMIPSRRVEALSRLKDIILQVIGNVKFAIKKEDEDRLEALRGRIILVEEMMDAVCYVAEDQVSHQKSLVINEPWFRKMLGEMQDIKETLNFPINNAGLIFRSSDAFTFDELLADIRDGG